MKEIVKINLDNEMDLILAHKRSMKLAELCGMSNMIQTSFATAVSEIARTVIGRDRKSVLRLMIELLRNNRKNLIAVISTNDKPGKELQEAVKYANRLTGNLKVTEKNDGTEVTLTNAIVLSGLINDARLDTFSQYFKTELPLSPYDEIRKKNIQLLEMAEKLKESEQQYKTLTETLPLMMFSTNGGGYLQYANRWFRDYFGLAEIPKGKLNWLNFVHLSDAKEVREDWEKSQTGAAVFSSQARLKHKNHDEQPLWHLISVLPVKNDNQVTGWMGFFVDIHAQKTVEETLKNNVELKAAQKQLLGYQQQLEEKVIELNKSNHDLEQFAYIASHDLKEPLRKIRSFTELVERNLDDKVKAKRYIGKIDSSSQRMITLIRDVLNYSRLSKSENKFEETSLGEVLNTVKQDIELLLEEKKAVIKTGELPVVSGIRQQLYQLFYNLINNSIKFSTTEPVITIQHRFLSADEIKSTPGLHNGTPYVELRFKDNGIGFEQKHARQIFTIFKRLNSRESYAGTGIGLALCKKIVDNHHGLISAHSAEGEGAEFVIVLPQR